MSRFQKIQDSLSSTKLILPIGLGLLVVFYMLWKNFDYNEFQNLSWNAKTAFFLTLTLIIYAIRHLAYSWRLKIICDNKFSWKKSIELIFIWEFASAISPTAIGGSATAMFFLAQEKLSGAKTVTIVLYTIVLDTLFFLLSMLFFVFILGPIIISPGLQEFNFQDAYYLSFVIVFFVMLIYGCFFFYALFINPKQISRLLILISRIRWLKRYKNNLLKTAMDIKEASLELKNKKWTFHFLSFFSTSIAWLGKFATIPLIIYGVIQSLNIQWNDFLILLARNESMFSITAFSPTPGGSGVTEALFGGFFKDYITNSTAVIIAIIWRLITFYSYLIAGIIIVPIWIGGIIKRRKQKD